MACDTRRSYRKPDLATGKVPDVTAGKWHDPRAEPYAADTVMSRPKKEAKKKG